MTFLNRTTGSKHTAEQAALWMNRRAATVRQASVGALVAAALLTAGWATAQVPVIESRGTAPDRQRVEQPATRDTRQAERPAADSESVAPVGSTAALFNQIQLLQYEVQELRGLVEEQAHQIERLARTQREQYLDVDRRLSEIRGGGAAQAGLDTDLVLPSVDRDEGQRAQQAQRPGSTGSRNETEAYTSAFDLTRERRFDEAIDAFERLIDDYPNGQFTANAYYWLGELYLALPEPQLEKSREAFEHVIDVYPSNQKVPDALYKLGVVLHMQGDLEQARAHLQRVQSEFSGSQAARLAASYATEIR